MGSDTNLRVAIAVPPPSRCVWNTLSQSFIDVPNISVVVPAIWLNAIFTVGGPLGASAGAGADGDRVPGSVGEVPSIIVNLALFAPSKPAVASGPVGPVVP